MFPLRHTFFFFVLLVSSVYVAPSLLPSFFSFSLHIKIVSANHLYTFILLIRCVLSFFFVCAAFTSKRMLLSFDLLVCLSVEFRGADRMGTEETVHIRINRRRRRNQIWHQWYDGCALSNMLHCQAVF